MNKNRFVLRILKFVLAIAIAVAAFSCQKDGDPVSSSSTAQTGGVRTGAMCNDGTTTTATGSGACSHHGGVKYWLY
jgi:hypothetical protein